MCGSHAYDKNNDGLTDATKFGGVRLLPSDYTKNILLIFVLVLTS